MAQQYPNRSDLRNPKVPVQAATGQTYGEAGKQIAAQRAVPMAAAPTDQPPAPVAPGQVASLTAPTERPNEPITAGASFGPGPGPEVFNGYPPANPTPSADFLQTGSKYDILDQVKYLYSKYPNSALMQLILEMESQED